MSRLEERYRSVLRVLPASYRDVWEEDMVATFLESVATGDAEHDEFVADYGRPSWSEVASIAALATRLRLGGASAPPRSFAWGEAVRLVALVALLTNAVMGTIGAGITAWLLARVAWLPTPREEMATSSDTWQTVSGFAGIVWVLAYFALVLDHRRAARWLAALGAVPSAVAAISTTLGTQSFSISLWFDLLLVDVIAILALAAFHRDAPAVRRGPWLAAFPTGIVLVSGLVFLTWPTSGSGMPLLDWAGMCTVAVVTAAMVHLAGPAVLRRLAPNGTAGRAHQIPSWSLALALLALAALVLRVVSLLDYVLIAGIPERFRLITLGIAEAIVLTAVGITLAARAARALTLWATSSRQ